MFAGSILTSPFLLSRGDRSSFRLWIHHDDDDDDRIACVIRMELMNVVIAIAIAIVIATLNNASFFSSRESIKPKALVGE